VRLLTDHKIKILPTQQPKYMLLKHKQLIGLLVKTQDGRVLGQIKDFEFNTEMGQIDKYIISSSELVKKILAQDLIINQGQVISIDNQEMIVDSGAISIKSTAEEPA